MCNKTLSIITPVYNTPLPFFKEYLQSIKDAEIEYPYEVIIVNDGSTNNDLLEFLNSISEENIKIFHKENGGVSSARNLGLKNAKGEFILCLDPDDILLPEINKVTNFLISNHNYDIAYCDNIIFGSKNYIDKKGNFSKFKLMYISGILASTSLFRKNILDKIENFNENLNRAEDYDFWCRAAQKGFQFYYYKTPFFKYRRIYDGKSLSQKNRNKDSQIGKYIRSQFDANKEITKYEVNKFVIYNFKDNKTQLLKLIIVIFFPTIFNFLLRIKIFKNDIVI